MRFKNMPKLGFGLMRLPEKDGAIDMEAVQKMVDAYMGSIELLKEAADTLE